MAQLLAAAGGKNGGIRDGTEVRIGGDTQLGEGSGHTDLFDECGQCVDTGGGRLLVAALVAALGRDTPDILSKPRKPRKPDL